MPPLASNAQAMRAILLARATATTLNGLRTRSPVSVQSALTNQWKGA